ncbi:MAG: WD40 repeat domain-containing protein [Sphingobacteriales bacterium]|nr:MAG: WD40 repeat domain-containing protein [Sphingobacteriales bacterium]
MSKVSIFFFLILLTGTTLFAQRFDDFKAFSSGKGAITAVCYNPSGTAFASGNNQGMLLIRDAVTGDILHILRNEGHTGEITHLSFHPDGSHLVSVATDGLLKVWELSSNTVIHEINARTTGGTAFYNFAYFSPDGNVILYGGSDGTISATRPFIPNSKPGVILNNNGIPFTCADYAETGNYLVAGSKQTIRVVDFLTKKVVQTINACSDEVIDVKYTPDNLHIGSLCKNGTFSMWDASTGQLVKSFQVTTPGPSTEIDFSPDGQYLVTGDTKNHVKVWNIAGMDINSDLTGHQASVRSVQFAPNSKNIITGGNDDQIKMWQWRKLIPNEEIPVPPTPPTPPPVQPVEKKEEPVVLAPPVNKPAELENVKLTYTTRNIPDSLGDRKVVPGRRMIVDSEYLEFWVWDEEYEDGDTISLYFNDQWILKEYLLTKRKLKIKVNINRNADNYLILYAHNEGTRPPNTAALTIVDGKKTNKIALASNMRKCDAINFKFREQR